MGEYCDTAAGGATSFQNFVNVSTRIMGRRHHRFLKSEQLESRRPLAADLAALDINDDMSVTALDALLIINTINQRAGTTNSVATAEAEAQLECDTNGDGVVTPIDVLNVVNQINSGIIAVPTDSTDTTTGSDGSDTGTVPTDSSEPPLVDTNPGDDVTTTPDDTSSDDSDSDSSDTSDPVDETDGTDTDDDVVSDPTDETDDDSTDDSTDDDTSDDTSDDDTSTEDPECEHDHTAVETARRLLIGHLQHGRGDLFAALDANGDGALSSDEVPTVIWDRLVEADTDSSDSVTKAELKAYKEAQRVAAVEAFFEQLDKDDSGTITSADVSRMAWRFLSHADANNDGGITVDELLAVPPTRPLGRSLIAIVQLSVGLVPVGSTIGCYQQLKRVSLSV